MKKVASRVCLCDSSKEQRKMEYEEILTPLGGGPVTALMRNFSINCPIHGIRIKQFSGHHITAERPPFSKSERKIVERKLTGNERKIFKKYIDGKYLAKN